MWGRRCFRCPHRSRRVTLLALCASLSIYVILVNVLTFDVTEHKDRRYFWRNVDGGWLLDRRLWNQTNGSFQTTAAAGRASSPIPGREPTTPTTPILLSERRHLADGDNDRGSPLGGLDYGRGLEANGTQQARVDGALRNGDLLRQPTSDTILVLAGNKRSYKAEFTVGIVTVKREKGDYFFLTLKSLLSCSSSQDQEVMTIVVMLADRNEPYNQLVLDQIKNNYSAQLESGLLLVVQRPDTEFLFADPLKRTYNDSLERVRWRSKQNLDYAALMEFGSSLSVYYLHLEDDVLAEQNYLSHVRAFISANAKTTWAMLEVCPHGFIGKLFRTRDLPKLVTILRTFYLEHPCDFLIKPYFINLMAQPKPIVRKGTLFFHQGQFSSLHNVTRKVDRLSKTAGKAVEAGKDSEKIHKNLQPEHRNPRALLFTEFSVYQTHGPLLAYESGAPGVFWASDVRQDQSLSILLARPAQLRRVVVETGFSDTEKKDILQDGRLEVGTSPIPDGAEKCETETVLSIFLEGRLDVNVTSSVYVTCLSIIASKNQTDWLIIRSILLYVKQ